MAELAAIAADNSGDLYGLGSAGQSYATVHDAAVGSASGFTTLVEIGQDYTASINTYNVRRGGLIFDTSSIPAGATISSAILSLFGWAKDVDLDFTITIVSGADLADPLVDADYGDLLNDTTSFGGMLASAFQVSTPTPTENEITLNATGIAAITKGGTTFFGIRSSKDIDNVAPTDGVFQYIQFRGTNASDSVKPKLTITYTIPFIPQIFII